ncbi:hypothetical protein AX16_001555 [Volvariella volvacea WC 439]|nr:hypothetical protein AX16_001555 [Volvariella volvacea WC 439]
MSEGGIQITIPDLAEDEFSSTPIPFGRSAGHGFGALGAFGSTTGSGQDSPTLMTPTGGFDRGDRGYFQSHNRGDSVASEDSTHSITTTRYGGRQITTFGHVSQSSITTTGTSFTKKPSFASIRNAFRKNTEPPPVPSLDHQPYPVLRNPFNRSTSSLNHTPSPTTRQTIMTPPQHRPPTPGSNTRTPVRSKSHGYAKSHHSQSGSVFYHSDGGSEHGFPFSPSSPPPVPRMPNAFGQMQMSRTPPIELDEDKVVMDPKTPADYALHAIFIRFAASAESKIDVFLHQVGEPEPLLSVYMGPNVDPKFDETLQSLGKIAQRHAKPVIDSIMRWRRSQNESVSDDIIRLHNMQSSTPGRATQMYAISTMLNERKSLASIYIMCRALIAVIQSISKNALEEVLGYSLEETTFEQFRRPEARLSRSVNHRLNAELFATLLGHIANVRFVSVTDRFLSELGPVAANPTLKDADMRYENLVRGLRHIQIKVWPPEAFEDGAEFMETLSKSYANARGQSFKITFAEVLVHMLHPIGKTAQAETNNPQWAQAIERMFPKARAETKKKNVQQWAAALPLMYILLCVSPHTFFLKNWSPVVDSIGKPKEKLLRLIHLNGILRIVWTYLYRCQESASTTASKLNDLVSRMFSSKGQHVYSLDDHLEFPILITHFILSRHPDTGRELCMDLMKDASTASTQPSGDLARLMAPEKTSVAVQAILLSLNLMEREVMTPTWPSSSDFTTPPSWEDYPSSSEFLPPSLLSKPGLQDFVEHCGSTLASIAVNCGNAVAHMSLLDDQWSFTRIHATYEETSNFVVRKHPDGAVVAYPNSLIPQISLLQTCFQAWPRCLHSSLALNDTVDLLLQGVVHVELSLGEAARRALQRFMAEPTHALTVLGRFNIFLFSPQRITQESGVRLFAELSPILTLWVTLVEGWIKGLLTKSPAAIVDDQVVLLRCYEIESAGLFLLAHGTRTVHLSGVKVMRALGSLSTHIVDDNASPNDIHGPFYLVERLHGKGRDKSYLQGYDELLDKQEVARLEQWRQSKRSDVPLRIVDSTHEKDRKLWRYVFPSLLQGCMDYPGHSLTSLRETIVASATRYHPSISALAGLSTRPFAAGRTQISTERDGLRLIKDNESLINQWHIWVKILCSTAMLSETSRPLLTQLGREHSRAPSDANFERERMSTTRGLFRYLTPFLDSEYTLFRDAAVLCISSFPSSAYSQLLEDLSLLAGRQFYDDPRSKTPALFVESSVGLLPGRQNYDEGQTPRLKHTIPNTIDRTRRQERLHSAVARIYYLTAHLLQQQRTTGRPAALANVLKFVRNTQSFLSAPEMKENHTLQRLRRYFCGTVERLFDGLATLKDSDRFIPPNMHLTLFRLCEEWCQLGPQPEHLQQRLLKMQRAAMASASGSQDVAQATEKFQHDTTLLSNAAVGALASLCQKAFFPPDQASNSPTGEKHAPEYLRPLTAYVVLDRLGAILASDNTTCQARGKKALKSILSHNMHDIRLMDESLRRAAIISDSINNSNSRFFEVIADIVCGSDNHCFTFSQIVCLGLSNLRHPLLETRRQAFNMLEAIHHQSAGLLSMSLFESTVGSLAPGTYVHAHRLVADFLAGEHPHQALSILAQLATWLPQLPEAASNTNVVLLLLQSLEFWIPNIDLMTEDKSGLSKEGLSALYHLVSLTLRYGQTHTEQILVIWSRLVEHPHQSNSHATVRFLLEQSHKVGSITFISCAANIVACLCQTEIGRQVFEELCSVIEPARMLPTIEHRLTKPGDDDIELWDGLNALFADQPRLQLGSAQFAWLFLADVALQRYWDLKPQLPVLLHALTTHLDHRVPFVRERAQRMLFQLLRAWAPGYDESQERDIYSRYALKDGINKLEEEAKGMFWKDDEPNAELVPKMKWLCSQVIHLLEPLAPSLAERWGSLALSWGTACSIRAIAFRSLQIFRALMPRVKQSDLALLLGRLSNTIAATDENIQSFTSEIILTINTVAIQGDLDHSLLPQMFWCAIASLSTTVEAEFSEIVSLLHSLLDRINLDNENTVSLLLSHCPPNWKGSTALQPALLKGLRSSKTSDITLKLLFRLAKVKDDEIIDPSDGRVRDLYTLSLPWCLYNMTAENPDDRLKEFAQDIGALASLEGRQSITKIMNSFAKGHFRTRDDFLRQSVSSLREHYGVDYWTDIVTSLLSLVLNSERWLQIHAMQILKVLFQQRETRNPVERLGSELLMPLLRLLETDLASQALEVLEEPMTMSGGPAAKHVLRMSMHIKTIEEETSSVTVVFGVPKESGWCIAQADVMQEICRANVMAVFDTCSMPTRPSQIDFEPEVEALASLDGPVGIQRRGMMSGLGDDDLGGLVKDLHDLTSFFQEADGSNVFGTSHPPLDRRIEARVAAILAKSTADTVVPPTPFLDVFRVESTHTDDDSNEEYSDIEEVEEDDEFMFDSPAVYRTTPNANRYY